MTALGRTHRVHAVDLRSEPGLSAAVRLSLTRGMHARWLREVAARLQADVATVAWLAWPFSASRVSTGNWWRVPCVPRA